MLFSRFPKRLLFCGGLWCFLLFLELWHRPERKCFKFARASMRRSPGATEQLRSWMISGQHCYFRIAVLWLDPRATPRMWPSLRLRTTSHLRVLTLHIAIFPRTARSASRYSSCLSCLSMAISRISAGFPLGNTSWCKWLCYFSIAESILFASPCFWLT